MDGWHGRWRCAFVLAAALALGACGGSGGGGAAGGDRNGTVDSFTVAGIAYEETYSGLSPDGVTSNLAGYNVPGSDISDLYARLDFTEAPLDDYQRYWDFQLYDPLGSTAPGTGTYAIVFEGPGDNDALVSVVDTTADPAASLCEATGGSVTIATFGPVGGTIEGTFTVDAFEQTWCSATPMSGSFRITREADSS